MASFAFNERVVTRSTSTLKAWQAVEYGPITREPDARTNVYFNDGNDVLMASVMSGRGAASVLTGVTYYERDDAGMIARQVRADRATFANPGWALEGARVFSVASATEKPLPEGTVVAPGVSLAQTELRRVDPDSEPLPQLTASIDALEVGRARRTAELEAKWWHKISGPLSAVLMPLLGAVAGFGLARSGQLLARAVLGMALGFAYFVVDNAALAMASFGGYPPLLAAWAPFFLFLFRGRDGAGQDRGVRFLFGTVSRGTRCQLKQRRKLL